MDIVPWSHLIPYLVTGVVGFGIGVGIFLSYLKSKNKSLIWLSLCFALFIVQGLGFAVPIILAPTNTAAVGAGHIVGVIAIFMILVASSRVESYTVMAGHLSSVVPYVTGGLLVSCLLSVIFMVRDFVPATIDAHTLFWNTPPIAGWLAGLTFLFYGLSWAVLFLINAASTRSWKQRLKILILAFDGALLGLSGFLGFIATGEAMLRYASLLSLFVAVMTVLMLLVTAEKIS